jgi:hypothetical protein
MTKKALFARSAWFLSQISGYAGRMLAMTDADVFSGGRFENIRRYSRLTQGVKYE